MKNKAGKKKKAPSREKYEKENPVVSFRVSRELYDRLQAVKTAEGKSVTDVLEVGVGLLDVKVRSEEEIREAAYEQGRIEGYEIAKYIYKVTYPCSVCGKEIEVESEEEKRAIKKYMREHGWGHASCINRR
jgi:hypothetical protein